MEKQELKAGDVVVLKSGSPHMTAQGVNARGHWVCKWFHNTTLLEGTFTAESLTKVPSE